MDIMDKIIIPSKMIKSLLITITVNQLGISPKMDKDKNVVIKSILSAMGSRNEPNSLCLLSNLANAPSRASVKPANVKVISALRYSS